jgi:hypothetical protein
MIRFACPTCGKHLKAADRGSGMKVSCTRCGQHLQIPAAPAPAPGARPPDATPLPRQVRANCPGCGREIRLAVGELGTLIECARCCTRFVPAGPVAAPVVAPPATAPALPKPQPPAPSPLATLMSHPMAGTVLIVACILLGGIVAVVHLGGIGVVLHLKVYEPVEANMPSVNVGHFIDHTPSYRGRTITLPLHTSVSMPGTLRDHRGHELEFWNSFPDGKLEMLILIPPGLDVPAVVSGEAVTVTFRCQGDLQLGNVAVEIRRRANDRR